MIAIQQTNNNNNNNNSGTCDNNKDLNDIKDITKKDEELNIFTPYSASFISLHSNTLTSNTSFLYDSESDASLPSLQIGQYSIDTDSDHVDPHDDDLDEDEEEQQEDIDPDLIPLIDRITPPPPLLFNDNTYHDEDHFNDMEDNIDDEDYNEYLYYHDDDDYDNDHDLQIMTKSSELFSNLSIVIPSPLTLSKSSPVHEQNTKCSLLELYNTVTPISSDNEDNDLYDDSDSITSFAQSDSDKYDIVATNDNHKSNEKRFEWNVPNSNNHTFVMNDYLIAHIQDLIDDNLSDSD